MNTKLSISALIFLFLCFVGTGSAKPANEASVLKTTGISKWVPNEIVVKFNKGCSKARIKHINQRHSTSVLYSSSNGGFKRIKVPAGKRAEEMVEFYSREADVEYAELNYYAYTLFEPDDPYYPYQWNLYEAYAGINIEPAWDITTGEPNVVIAVLDTGVAYEDFNGFEQASDLASTLFVPGYDFVGNDEHPNDEEGHGTHVTGTIAQNTNNGLGAAGVAFNCSIMPVRVADTRGTASYTALADGIYFAANNGADVINISLGGPSGSVTLRKALAYAYNKGVTIICSAGNEYEDGNPTNYPAAYDDYCIAVGATRFDQTRAYYSNTGSYLDLVAPGGDLDIDQNGDGLDDGIIQQSFGVNPTDWNYWLYAGTSMSAPHVSGIAALLISTGVSGPDAIREAMQKTARDLGTAGWDEEYGWGIVDAYAALNYYHNPADFNYNGSVDLDDLSTLLSYWLEDEASVDIAPVGGDNIINLLDFAKLAENLN